MFFELGWRASRRLLVFILDIFQKTVYTARSKVEKDGFEEVWAAQMGLGT
jgi:hypothetical protein